MSPHPMLDLRAGKIKFAGSVRGIDESGHRVFEVTLPGGPSMYGDWDSLFDENGRDFIVEIYGFGYLKMQYLGDTNPNARRSFANQEISAIEHLVRALFANEEARKAVRPFTHPAAVYRGVVAFRAGWILRRAMRSLNNQ